MYDPPAIFIDQKKCRIRIYRRTICQLGNPKFIQLLINPEDLILIVRPADHLDGMTHRIVWKNLGRQSYELTSKGFIQKMRSMCVNWAEGKSYRIFGEIISMENIACFDLRKAMPHQNDKDTQ